MQHFSPAGAHPSGSFTQVWSARQHFSASSVRLHFTMHSGITATLHQLTLASALQVWALRLACAGLHLASARP